jgi:diguanylate cyclase (GGDEF)-like protein
VVESSYTQTCTFGETVLSIRASIGVSIYPGDAETADDLLKRADKAMYKAKRTEKEVIPFREST